MNRHGHPLAADLEKFWREHGSRHDDPAWQLYLKEFGGLLSAKLTEMGEEHSNGGLFGMSKAAGCTRAATLKAAGAEEEAFSGSTLVTFSLGHLCEILGIATLRAAGYEVTGVQQPVTIPGLMQSASDGIISIDGEQMILSVKSVGYKLSGRNKDGSFKRYGFAQLPFDGILGAQATWWPQAQAEMHGSGLTKTMFLVVAKDMIKVMEQDEAMKENGSLSFYAEVVEYDRAWCEEELMKVWQQAKASVEANRLGLPWVFNGKTKKYVQLPEPGVVDPKNIWGGANQTATGSFNFCGGCSLVDACREGIRP